MKFTVISYQQFCHSASLDCHKIDSIFKEFHIILQIVLQIGEEVDEMVTIRAANNRQAMCPLIYLQEL